MNKLKLYGPWALALLGLFSAIWSWYHPKYESDGTTRTVYQNVTKNVTKTVPVACPNGVIRGTGADFVIPASQTGSFEPVLSEGDVPASQGGFDLKTTLSPTTGEVTIWAKPTPRAFFGFENDQEIGIRYNLTEGQLFGRWTFVRVGSFYGSAYAEGSTDHHFFGGFEISYRR